MSEEKTYVFTPEGGGYGGMLGLLAPMLQQNGIDPNVLLAMRNNGGFGDGNNFLWIIFLFFLMGWGNWGGNGFAGHMNNDCGKDLLMQAISGNRTAVSELATNLNCSINQVQSALSCLGTQVQSVGNQVGMSGQQIINAIQSGNCSIANQLASCCCETRQAITTQGYENRIATQEQTNILGSKIDQQTTLLNDRFCQLEMREMQNKIDNLREEKSSLQAHISNIQQTNQFGSMIASATNPLAASLNAVKNELDGIKCKLPETKTIPANNGIYLEPCVAMQLGLYGGGFYNTYNNGSIWS